MSVLVNPQTKEVQEFSPEESQKLLSQGWLIPLINREGKPEALHLDEGQAYLQEGYRNPNDQELNHLLAKTHFSSGPQQGLAFAEGVVRGVTGAAYDYLAPKTGLTTKEEIKGREEFNPELSKTAERGSTVIGALTGTGLPGIIGKVGKAAGVFGKVARGAAEGALYSAANKIDERLLGDPESTAENILGHVGLGAFLGGGAALALTPAAGLINKVGKLGQKAAGKLTANDAAGKVLEKVYDLTTDLAPLGLARPLVRGAKRTVIDSLLSAAPEKGATLNSLLNIASLAGKTANAIETKAAGIFGSEAEKLTHSEKPTEDLTKEPEPHKLGTWVMDYATDPEKLINNMNQNVLVMANHAPDVSNAVSANVARAVTFLAAKVPKPVKEGLLDAEQKPSRAEIQKFNQYAQVIEDPVSVLLKLKDATLLPQDIEALNAVYPGLYAGMKTAVMDKLISKMGKQKSLMLPYNKRMSLSLFLGTHLDSSLKPQSIMSNQQAFGTMQIQKHQQNQMQGMARASKTGMGRMDPFKDLTRSQRALTRR